MNVVERSNDGVKLKKCPFCDNKTSSYRDKEIAIEKWNNRKPLERVIERLEEQAESAEKALEKLFCF